MSNKTNDEKLKILRNRLAEIQEKQNTLNKITFCLINICEKMRKMHPRG